MSRRGTSGRVNVVTGFFLFVSLVGLLLSLGAGYLVIRGPFLGGPTLEPIPLLVALGVFIVGVVALSWGATKAAAVGGTRL